MRAGMLRGSVSFDDSSGSAERGSGTRLALTLVVERVLYPPDVLAHVATVLLGLSQPHHRQEARQIA